jgi:hypothetical protein
VGADWLLLTVLALVCAACDRRLDVFLFSPLYGLMRFVDCTVLIYSFCKTVILRKQVNGWFAVKRY